MASVTQKVVADEEEAKQTPIHGDILEKILSHVPLLDLVPASHVSRAWNHAVSSSLRNFIMLKPWLVVHTQSTRSPYLTTAHAYDPRSHVWIEFRQPPIKYVSTLRSSHSNLLYMLSPSKLSFSFDPLHLTWHHADAPFVWRTDPIVAVVGRRVIVAGGSCDFEDDPLAVEIYDIESREWDTCQSMPAVLKDSAASTWLSIAANDRNLFVTEKYSGMTHTYDPETKTWCGPYDLRPEPCIFYSVIAFSDDRLILIGLIGDGDSLGVKLWEVDSDTFNCKEIGEMPLCLIEKLKMEIFQVSSIGVCLAGNIAYIYNPSEVEEIVMCELVAGGCRWRSVRNVVASDRNWMERFVFTCSDVGIDDVNRALRSENLRFAMKTSCGGES
ncbi:F-box/kelch-repeat protein At1g23390 [Cornus florida]|uniref:F-box/kelch-repeat protein At1g23390 n=1 Tax=Cornus florida TaxID=4283 RepID=UPI002897E5FF|nr:F-box/kelch-repeat protein At1g23390 [Cornus florida]